MTAAGVARTMPGHGASGQAVVSRPGGMGDRGDRRGRSLLVVGESVELAVALRERLDRAYITVFDARSGAEIHGAPACDPWPWMLVGEGGHLGDELSGTVTRHPVLVLWRGDRPRGLPAHARAFALFSELANAVAHALRREVDGIRLAPGTGLTMPDGAHCGSAALEALVANHPDPVVAPMREFRGAAAALASHRVPLRIVHDTRGVSLVPTRESR